MPRATISAAACAGSVPSLAKPICLFASRIAAGSGTQPGEINQLVRQFREMRKMMKQMGNGPGRKGAKARGGKKGRKGRGGRTTDRGPVLVDKKKGLSLPGLGDLPSGLGGSGGGLSLD